MSCSPNGLKDVSDFFSGIFTSEETEAVMNPVLSPAIDTLQTATNVPKTVYTVQSGDTLAKIGKAHNVEYHEIAKANGINNHNDIVVGQELKIPNGGKTPPSTLTPKPTKKPISDETSMGGGKEDGCEKSCKKTWDSHTTKRLKKLHPKIKCSAFYFINEVEKKYNIKLRVVQGLEQYQNKMLYMHKEEQSLGK